MLRVQDVSYPVQFSLVEAMLRSPEYILFRKPMVDFFSYFNQCQSVEEILTNVMKSNNIDFENAKLYFKAGLKRLDDWGIKFNLKFKHDFFYFLLGFLDDANVPLLSVTIRQLHTAILATSSQEEAAIKLDMLPMVFKQLLGRLKLNQGDKIPYDKPSIQDVYAWLKDWCQPTESKIWFHDEYDSTIKLDFPVLFDEMKFDLAIRSEPTLMDAAANLGVPIVFFEFCMKTRLGLTNFQQIKMIFSVNIKELLEDNVESQTESNGAKMESDQMTNSFSQTINPAILNPTKKDAAVQTEQELVPIPFSSALFKKRLLSKLDSNHQSLFQDKKKTNKRSNTNNNVVMQMNELILTRTFTFNRIYQAIHTTSHFTHAAVELGLSYDQFKRILPMLQAMYPQLPYGVTKIYQTLFKLENDDVAKSFENINQALRPIMLIQTKPVEKKNNDSSVCLTLGPVLKAIFHENIISNAAATLCIAVQSFERYIQQECKKDFQTMVNIIQQQSESALRSEFPDYDSPMVVLTEKQVVRANVNTNSNYTDVTLFSNSPSPSTIDSLFSEQPIQGMSG